MNLHRTISRYIVGTPVLGCPCNVNSHETFRRSKTLFLIVGNDLCVVPLSSRFAGRCVERTTPISCHLDRSGEISPFRFATLPFTSSGGFFYSKQPFPKTDLLVIFVDIVCAVRYTYVVRYTRLIGNHRLFAVLPKGVPFFSVGAIL